MQSSKIVITLELNCAPDISEEHMITLVSNSLSWVAHRVGQGETNGNLHHTSGKPYGKFDMLRSDKSAAHDDTALDTFQKSMAYAAAICGEQFGMNSHENIGVARCLSAIRHVAGYPEATAKPNNGLSPALTELLVRLVRQIQADTLEHAADICEKQTEPKDGEEPDYSNGHANRGIGNCQDAIRAAAKSLEDHELFSPTTLL